MNLKIKSAAIGSSVLTPVPGNQVIVNGNFTVTSNVPTNIRTGDGIDERTEWNFDFKTNLNWGYYSSDSVITSCKLTLTLSPKRSDLRTDIIKINYGPLSTLDPSLIRAVPVGETRTIEMEMLTMGYTSDEILSVLNNNNGVIPMLYHDDSIISYAELEICQDVSPCGCKKLCVEAVSEDGIANPGNRRPNYLLISVTDADGNPLTNLDKNNFKVDPMIVGPGGSLVDITRVQHSSRIDGFYFVDLKPIKKRTWKAGVYVFAVAVNSKGKRGQNLASVLMD